MCEGGGRWLGVGFSQQPSEVGRIILTFHGEELTQAHMAAEGQLGLSPALSDLRAELLTMTLYTPPPPPPRIQQPANGDTGTVFTVDTHREAYFNHALEVLTFHSFPRSLRLEAHGGPLTRQICILTAAPHPGVGSRLPSPAADT